MVLACAFLLHAARLGGPWAAPRALQAKKLDGPKQYNNDGLDALLVAAAGGGSGPLQTQFQDRRVHVSKYRAEALLDPWEAAIEAAVQELVNATVVRQAATDPFTLGAAALRKQGGLQRKPVAGADADGRDPSTFGFVEIGTIIGSHGVRGYCRVDSTSDFGEIRFCEPGVRHLKLPSRRSPRAVFVSTGRRLKVFGAKTRYIVKVDGIETREAANALKGSTLYVADEERAPDDEEEYYLVDDLVGATVFHVQTEERIGVVVDVFDPPTTEDGVSLGHSLLEITLDAKPGFRCLIPLADPIVPKVDTEFNAVYLEPPDGLFGLAYPYVAPPVFIRGFLPPPKDHST
ncbi:hypothetical protein M885DRAFT_514267 [Pelagophyceae sp. CCMP2097]|nr:hypothetical protein M885DRAFT_514267 [Pelagophyceae sp. CCMP2097]